MPFEEDLPQSPFDDSAKSAPDNSEDLLKAMDTPDLKNKTMNEIRALLHYRDQSMADVATRYDILSDLLAQWEDTVELMGRRSFLGRDELFKKAGIEFGIKQLKKTMEATKDYGDFVDPIRRHINQVPKAFAIYGGRSTPLSKPFEPWVPDPNEEIT